MASEWTITAAEEMHVLHNNFNCQVQQFVLAFTQKPTEVNVGAHNLGTPNFSSLFHSSHL